ncbi:HAD family hydrolase [Actinoplanes philippinensis]|uniref:HAD family hydrolase n=1 Tax=Actinoplanes philippinensis TaxID=35752 RepID=UPI0033E82399
MGTDDGHSPAAGVAVVVDHVVWDMDGTLLDSSREVPAAFVRAVRVLGGPPVGAGEVVGAYWRGTPEVILSYLVGRELSAAECDVYYRELEGVSVSAYPGVVETLAGLRRAGLPVVVFTGASGRSARVLLAAAGVAAEVIVGGDEAGRPKPAPDGLLVVAARLGVGPERLVLVGDSPLDLGSASAAGSVGAAAAWGHMYDASVPAEVTLRVPSDVLGLLG